MKYQGAENSVSTIDNKFSCIEVVRTKEVCGELIVEPYHIRSYLEGLILESCCVRCLICTVGFSSFMNFYILVIFTRKFRNLSHIMLKNGPIFKLQVAQFYQLTLN